MNGKKECLNLVYGALEAMRTAIFSALNEKRLDASWGFFNGHYHKDANGFYRSDAYPIPVVTVAGICDIEIDLSAISVSTRMEKRAASEYDLSRFCYPFEAYGVEDFLHDFPCDGVTSHEWKHEVLASSESEIGFSFYFENDISAETIVSWILFLKNEGFYNE